MNEELRQRIDEQEAVIAEMQMKIEMLTREVSLAPQFSTAIQDVRGVELGEVRDGNIIELLGRKEQTATSLGVIQASARLKGGDWLGDSVAGNITFTSIEHETDDTILDANLSAGTITTGQAAIYQVILNGHARIEVSPTTELGGFTSATVRNDLAASLETRILLRRTNLATYARSPFIVGIEVASVVNVSLPAGRVLSVYGQNTFVGGSTYGIRDLDFMVNYVCPS